MIKDLNKIFPKAVFCEKNMMEMGDGVELAVYKLLPKKTDRTAAKEPLLFIPGFIAYLEKWAQVINGLVKFGFPVYVMETREKTSSTATTKDERFSVSGLMADLSDVLKQLNLPNPFSIIGTSLGSAMALKHIIDNKEEKLTPDKIVLIEAVYTSSPLNRLMELAKRPILFKLGIKLIILFAPIIMRREKKRNKVAYSYSLISLKQVDIDKMRVGLLCSREMDIVNELRKVKVPTLIFGIRDDKHHPIEQAKLIVERVQNGRFIEINDLETLHSEQIAAFIASFLDEESKIPHPFNV